MFTDRKIQDDDAINSQNFYENALTEAISELSSEMLKKLGIDIINGTMMKITVLQAKHLWKIHKGKMLEAMETLEGLIKSTVEDTYNGLLVNITPHSFICFFPDKNKQHSSIIKGLQSACSLQMNLLHQANQEGIKVGEDHLRIQICISYGPVYKRTLHIQRKILYDYHGAVLDDLLYKSNGLTAFENITICNNHPVIKKIISELCHMVDGNKLYALAKPCQPCRSSIPKQIKSADDDSCHTRATLQIPE